MKKSVLSLLVVLLVFVNVFAYAGVREEIEVVITPFYVYTDNLTANLTIDSSGNATCRGVVIPKDSSYSCSITVKLKRQSGSSWSTIATWTGSGQGYAGASAGGTKKVSSGYNNMVSVSTVVKNSSGSVIEQPSKNSGVKTY